MFTRKNLSLVLAMSLSAVLGTQAAADRTVPVYVNGGRLESEARVHAPAGRTLLPMRTLFESLGARVEWDSSERAVYAWTDNREGVRIGLGERHAQRLEMSENPQRGRWGRVVGTQRLDAPAMLVGERVFVPLRFASEALNAQVRYSAAEPAVYIQTEAVAGYRGDLPEEPRRDPPGDRREERPRTPEENLEARLMRDVAVELELPGQRFGRTESSMPIRLVVRNEGKEPIRLPFSSGQQFNIEVEQEGRLLWSWAADRAFTQALTAIELQPGEERVFRANWNLRTNAGRRLSPGRYLVRGILTTATGDRQTVETRIVIEG